MMVELTDKLYLEEHDIPNYSTAKLLQIEANTIAIMLFVTYWTEKVHNFGALSIKVVDDSQKLSQNEAARMNGSE